MVLPLVIFLAVFVLPEPAEAIIFDLIAPQTVTRGSNAVFTLNIDSEGENVTNTEIGMNFETQYLEFVGAVPGAAMANIEVVNVSADRFLLKGSNPAGFSGNGIFATVTFKVIATAPGSTILCGLWGPDTTPTPPPEGTPIPTVPTFGPTIPPGQGVPTVPPGVPTQRVGVPVPTTLPKAGNFQQTSSGAVAGISLILVAFFSYFFVLIPDQKRLRTKKEQRY